MTVNGFNVNTPNVARVNEYALGGKSNFLADRDMAAQIFAVDPEARQVAWDNRHFLERAVTYAAEKGIDQFVDIGCGLPVATPVHDVAWRVAESARVAYVDNDPLVMAHARALLAGNRRTTAVAGDLAKPTEI